MAILKSAGLRKTGTGHWNVRKRMSRVILQLSVYLRKKKNLLDFLNGHSQRFLTVQGNFNFGKRMSHKSCAKTESREYYNRKKNDLKSRSKTNDKPEVEKWAKEYLRSKLQDEYELYNLIKRIFYYKIGKLGFDDFK